MARKFPTSSKSGFPRWDADLFVEASFANPARLAITKMLQALARMTGSSGAALWRCTKDVDLTANPPLGHMNLVAGWLKAGNMPAIARLPLHDDKGNRILAAEAVILQKERISNNIKDDGVKFAHLFESQNITRALAIPMVFHLTGRKAAICLYRRSDQPEFSDKECTIAQQAAKILSRLYRSTWDRAAYELLKETEVIVNDFLTKLVQGGVQQGLAGSLRRWAKAVQHAFQCQEVAIFLPSSSLPESFECRYVTPGPHAQKARRPLFARRSTGFSGLVLEKAEPLRIHDTRDCTEMIAELKAKHPGFERHSPDENGGPHPHAWLGAPIFDRSGKVGGLVHCWNLRTGRFFFSTDDIELLELAIRKLEQLWRAWQQEQEHRREKKAWEELARAGGGHYRSKKGVYGDTFVQGLRLVEKIIPDAEINTVRLIDAANQSLYFYAYPTPSEHVSKHELDAAIQRSQQLDGEGATSLAAGVVKSKRTRLFENVSRYAGYRKIFEDVRHMIIAPIIDADEEVVGVIDIRSCKDRSFPASTVSMAETIGRLMGIEYSRVKLQEQAWENKRKEADAVKQQAQAYEDIAHQMKGPLTDAERRLSDMIDAQRWVPPADLNALRGMVKRSLMMAKIVGVIAKLGYDERLTVHGIEITPADWVKLAGEICLSNQPRLAAQNRNVRLNLNADSFYKHVPTGMRADLEFVTQALSCIVDNAVKYSYSNTKIEVYAGKSKTGKFWVCVSNQGIPILGHETKLFKRRGERGAKAQYQTGEGNGVGLWIVDKIMEAHGGSLEIAPTRKSDGITEVRLVFKDTII
jgi:GAF domain-containing protein